jgi:hypothetical protein
MRRVSGGIELVIVAGCSRAALGAIEPTVDEIAGR